MSKVEGLGTSTGIEEKYAKYNETSKYLASYFYIEGMFQTKKGQTYDTYKDINKDPVTWKRYNSSLRYNQHQMQELVFSLDDAELMGSGESVILTTEVLNQW